MSTIKAPVGPHGPDSFTRCNVGHHVVQFYSDDEPLLDALSHIVGSAIAQDDSAVVIATASHLQELSARLQVLGFDLAAAARQYCYVALDAAATLSKIMVEGWPEASRFIEVVGSVL